MSKFGVSPKVKEKVLSEIKKIDQNDMRILYLLRNLGPIRFTNIIEYSSLSRSTVSKYIKFHLSKNNIEKKIYRNPSRTIQEQRYFITDLGTEKLGEDYISYDESIYFSEINDLLSNLSELKNFYKEISVADSIITDITRIIINMGENYFLMEQNRDLYLTLFYIYNNSVLTRDFKFEITEFCKHYNVKKLRIDFYVDRLLSSDLGLYMFSRGEDKFFFHREDVLGVTTIRLIKDNLINEIVELSISEEKMIADIDLDKLAEEITEKLLKMELIWDKNESQEITGIKEPFEMLVEKMIIKYALEMGIPKTSLMDIALQSKKLLIAEGGKNSLYNIINNSERYEDLNLVSISDSEETGLFQSLKLLQGFCPKCGKTMLKNILSNICVRCGLSFQESDLLKDIEAASELSVAYKLASLEEEKEIECPNPDCNYQIKLNWDVCPNCLTPITKEGTNEIHRNVRSIANKREQIKRSMDIKKLKNLASNGALGQLDIRKAQVGSNGYGFVFFDFHPRKVDRLFWKASSKVCGAGANFGDFESFTSLDDVKFDKLSNINGLLNDLLHDLLLAGSLKTLLPDMEFGGDEMLFDVLMFVMTPNDQFFPTTFYYGPSGTSLGGWRLEKYQTFPREIRDEFNFSPFDLDKDGLTGLIEAQIFALQKVPVSDFCGIYSHDLGNALNGVHDGVAFIQELGYDYDESDVEIFLDYLGYDFEQDKFNFREMVKKSLNLFKI